MISGSAELPAAARNTRSTAIKWMVQHKKMLSALQKTGTLFLKLYICNWYTLLSLTYLIPSFVKCCSEWSFSSAIVKGNHWNLTKMPSVGTSLLLWPHKRGRYIVWDFRGSVHKSFDDVCKTEIVILAYLAVLIGPECIQDCEPACCP